jgi:hypothetical protein
MKTIPLLFLLSIAILTTSCSVFEKSASISTQELYTNKKEGENKEQGTLFWAQYDASKRGSMVFVDPDNNVRVLSENPPDVAMQTITELSTKIKGTGEISEVEAILKTQQSVAELGKRTAAVNMLRDALYRLNEMYYSARDEKKFLLEQNKDEYFQLLNSESLNESVKDNATLFFSPTISDEDIKELFLKVIDNTKEISIAESEASISVENSKSKARIANAKLMEKQFTALMDVFKSTEDEMTVEEKKELLNQIMAIKNN